MGRVLSATDRRVKIEQVHKLGMQTVLERNPQDISVVVSVDELAVNCQAYFSRRTPA